MVIKNTKKISDSFMENISYMDRTLPVGKSFDLIKRTIEIGERKAVLYFIDGFVKDEAMLKLMDSFMGVTKEAMPKEAEMFSQRHVPYIEVDVLKDFDQVLRNVLSGVTCLFIEGYAACIAIDTRTYPARSVEEPDKDKSLRGSRDGFVETIVFNTALMRRRIRDEHHQHLFFSYHQDIFYRYKYNHHEYGMLYVLPSQENHLLLLTGVNPAMISSFQ